MRNSRNGGNGKAGIAAPMLTRRAALALFGGAAAGGLAACTPTSGPQLPSPALPGPVTPVPTGDVLGTGTVKVALLLPRSAQGNAAVLATSMRNAAELGLNDFTANDLTVLVKDSMGTPEGAAQAATAAIAEGAEIILGPVFAAEVRGAGPVAVGSGRSVLSFSSDPSVAAPGVYVMGFLVDDQVRQVVAQAAASGRKSMAALIPDGAYGTLAEAALREATARHGVRLTQLERYTAADLAAKAQAVAANAAQIDSVFIPEGPGVAPRIAAALATSGVTAARVKLLGTGQWNDPAVYADPALAGAWFPAPEITGFQSFAGRYRAAYGAEPPLTATLAYDAVVLAAGLVKAAGAQRFQPGVLANPEGFLSSVNGLFRFNGNGTNDRGLAVYEATGTGVPKLVSPAPRAFTGI